MLTNKEIYEEVINVNKNFNISISDFSVWLEDNNYTKLFSEELDKIENEDDLYYVAVDFTIPVSMVKYFLRKRQRIFPLFFLVRRITSKKNV